MPSLRPLPRKQSPHPSRSIPARKAARPVLRKGDDGLDLFRQLERSGRAKALKLSELQDFISITGFAAYKPAELTEALRAAKNFGDFGAEITVAKDGYSGQIFISDYDAKVGEASYTIIGSVDSEKVAALRGHRKSARPAMRKADRGWRSGVNDFLARHKDDLERAGKEYRYNYTGALRRAVERDDKELAAIILGTLSEDVRGYDSISAAALTLKRSLGGNEAKAARPAMRKASPKKPTPEIAERLEYLRGEIEAERISMGEIAELQSLTEYIDDDDVLLLEWAGVEEGSRGKAARPAMRKVSFGPVKSEFIREFDKELTGAQKKRLGQANSMADFVRVLREIADQTRNASLRRYAGMQANEIQGWIDADAREANGKAARPAMRKAGDRKVAASYTATDISGIGTIYYSYDMPVAADIEGVGQIRRAKKFSATTTQHLNRFAPKDTYREVDEAEWARIVGPHAKDAAFQPRSYGRKAETPAMRKSLSELKRLAIVEPDPRLRANYAEDLAERMGSDDAE